MSNRNIPDPIRRELRREVNWGCPITDCGNPFLSYHHFSPLFRQFKENTEHNPEGIIALCLSHAGEADGGVFTDEQLRALKRQPFLKGEKVEGRTNWLRRDVVIRAGTNLFVNVPTFLEIDGKPVIWFTRNSQGELELSMNIGDNKGRPIFVMDRNDWLVSGPIDDLEAKPRARDIVIRSRHRGFSLSLEFQDLTQDRLRSQIEERAVQRERARVASQNALYEQLRARVPNATHLFPDVAMDETAARGDAWAPFQQGIKEWPALEIHLEGNLPHPVNILSTSKALQLPGLTMTGSIVIGSGTVFAFRSS